MAAQKGQGALGAAAPVGLAWLDDDLVIAEVNPAFAHLSGRSATRLVGCALADVLPEAAAVVAALRGGGTGTSAAVLDGTGAHRESRWIVSAARDGERGGMVLSLTDLPPSIVAARRREIEQQAIFDSVPAMIWFKDRNNRIVRCNRLAAESMGMSVEDMEGRQTEELYPHEAEAYLRDDREVIDSGRPKLGFVEPYRLPSGERRWVRTDKVPLWNSVGPGVLVFAVDITGLKQAELEREQLLADLRAQRALLEGVLRQLPVSVLIAEVPRGNLVLANERSSEIFGAPFPMAGSLFEYSIFGGFHADGRAVAAEEWPLARAVRGEVITGEELEFVRADGSRVLLRISATPIYGPDGSAIAAAVIFDDVTADRRAEQERARLYREAQEAVLARDEFLSVASHELKTPVTALRLQVQSLLRSVSREPPRPLGPAELAKKLSSIERQVERVVKLVGDLLDITRITARGISLEIERVDLREVVHDVVDRAHEAIERAHSSVVVSVPDAPVRGHWDRLRWDQMVTNLLSNALKYGAGRPIEITVDPRRDEVLLSVRDHGMGIAPEDQRRIFGRFERAVSDRHYGGLGIGLWIVQRIAGAMGGIVEVESEPGEGSTFTVRMPYAPRAPAEHREGARP